MFPTDSLQASPSPFQPHWLLYPKSYDVNKIDFPLLDHLDGDLSKDVWKEVPFSDAFDDIRGPTDAPDEERPNDHCTTRFKAVWDDTHLYIGAILQSDFETQAHFTERNSPIFQKDSDFEVFLDPFGICHNYKELEVNAINTVWNLMLDKPYDDGGVEHSARIAKPGDDLYYEVQHQKTATKLLKGKLNDPTSPSTWSIEVALSFKDLLAYTTNSNFTPKAGSMMRINFSRVERQGAINWTWQPQIVWDPSNKRYSGYVAMHLPDAWGYFVLTDQKEVETKKGATDAQNIVESRDPTWPGRLAAMNVYYAQKVYSKQHGGGAYATTIDDLAKLIDETIVGPFQIQINVNTKSGGYVATVVGNPDGSIITVTEERLLVTVRPDGQSIAF